MVQVSGVWAVRVAWALLPLVAGGALADGLHAVHGPLRTTASTMAWGIWAAVLVATLVPRTVSLTALRVAAPLSFVAVAWAAGRSDPGVGDVVAATWAALVLVAVFNPFTSDAFVDGSSYGDERRFALRPPLAVLLGPAQLAWAAVVAPVVAGPLLLADRRWLAGGLVLALGAPAVYLGMRALHGLSRRWLVFVPAGVVVHDPVVLADPVLVPRRALVGFGPAPAGTAALDLTGGALGLGLELEASEPLPVARARRRAGVEVTPSTRLLVTPARPGAVLAEAGSRRLLPSPGRG